MSISNARAKLGLSASFTSVKQGVSGTTTLGEADSSIKLTDSHFFYTRRFVFAEAAELTIELAANNTTGSDSWVAGNAQVETATAAGTISTAGNATVIVTSAGMSGSPLTVTFAVALSDTATLWATKARAALEANATIAARFAVSGTTTAIILTRKPLATFDVPGGTLNVYGATDATLNIALADDTSAGITEATTSAGTTVGVASSGVKIYGADGVDHEGEDLPATPSINSVRLQNTGGLMTALTAGNSNNILLAAGEDVVRACATGIGLDGTMVITASAAASALTLTVVGYPA